MFLIFIFHKKNTCIEYQGEQHYHPVQFGGITLEDAQHEFELANHRDKIKRDYCDKNSINLICISYWDYDNIEQILSKI